MPNKVHQYANDQKILCVVIHFICAVYRAIWAGFEKGAQLSEIHDLFIGKLRKF